MENMLQLVDVLKQLVQKGEQQLYSNARLSKFLDDTKGRRKISIAFFSLIFWFLMTSTVVLINACMTELNMQKRYH